jgi:pyrimidine operon attenuation protein/uracil phosphoribosyltransferase
LPANAKKILDQKQIDRALIRIAHEIVEKNSGAKSVAIIGIWTRGAYLAKRIAATIERIEGIAVPVGFMDIGLYRDDIHTKLDQPVIQQTEIFFPVGDKNIVLVDDVLFTGRTIRAALDQIIDFGRPHSIQLAVLVDRGHRELPIKADYVGVNIPTARDDRVILEIVEKEGTDQVYVETGKKSRVGKSSTKKVAGKPARKKAAARKKGGTR